MRENTNFTFNLPAITPEARHLTAFARKAIVNASHHRLPKVVWL